MTPLFAVLLCAHVTHLSVYANRWVIIAAGNTWAPVFPRLQKSCVQLSSHCLPYTTDLIDFLTPHLVNPL